MSDKPVIAVRLTKTEQKILKEKYFQIANSRLEKGLKSLDESEIVHKILDIALPRAKTGKDGEITIDK